MKEYAVTGTFHGSICYANSEGEARRMFHKKYNGESILSVRDKTYGEPLTPDWWFDMYTDGNGQMFSDADPGL